jgi:hypothetical protein
MSVLTPVGKRDGFADLSRFRTAFYECLSARADAFFELADALLCADGPTRAPVELSLLAEQSGGPQQRLELVACPLPHMAGVPRRSRGVVSAAALTGRCGQDGSGAALPQQAQDEGQGRGRVHQVLDHVGADHHRPANEVRVERPGLRGSRAGA